MAEDTAVHGEIDKRQPVPPSNDPPEAEDPDDEQPRQTLGGRVASTVLILLAVAALAVVIALTNRSPRTDDAEVFANYIGLAPLVNGPITEVHVRDNQQVRAGEVLFRIDDRPYRYALERAVSDRAALEGQIEDEGRRIRSLESAAVAADAGTRSAEASVGEATAAVDQARLDITNAEAALARAQADALYARNNLRRIEPLLAKQFVTVDQVDQLRTGTANRELAVRQADAQLQVAKARLQSSLAALTASQASVLQSSAQHQQAQHAVTTLDPYTAQRGSRLSAVQDAEYNLNNCTVQAPFDARVTNLTLSEGAYARAGQQVFTLIDTRVWWVIANFRETQLRRILPGMHVAVYLMSDPRRMYRGVVESASYGVTPDANTVGTLQQGLPDAQRTLSWVHLASRYPVRIRILDPEPNQLRIAESAVAVVRGWDRW